MSPTEDGGSLALWGPLGAAKTRRQLGRSIKLEAAGGRTRAEVLVFTGPTTADAASELDIGDALASTCTITLAIIQQNVSANEPVAVIEGTIEWGTDGTSASARFDWLNGGVIVAAAASFKVSAEIVSIPAGRSVEVAAFIGYYTVPCCTGRLTRVAPGPVGVPITIPIPQMAQAVLPLTDDLTGAIVQFTSDLAGTIALYGPHTLPPGPAPVGVNQWPVPIPPGAAAVIVTPTDAGGPIPIKFVLSM
jgi:hypothetical protein